MHRPPLRAQNEGAPIQAHTRIEAWLRSVDASSHERVARPAAALGDRPIDVLLGHLDAVLGG